MAALEDFLARVTSEHNQRDRFMRTVALSVQPYVDGINVANSLIALFDLDAATGAQLDALGQWVGVSRNIDTQPDVWFALDIGGVGLDQGKWANPYETANQTVALDDQQYRQLLRARIVSNHWDGTIPGAYEAWNTLFAGTDYQVLIQDGLSRAERDFSLDTVNCGLDESIWFHPPPPVSGTYFSLDIAGVGLDEGLWLSGSQELQPWAVTNGNMNIIVALLGPPLDEVTKALFAGGYLGLDSAGVGTVYMVQGQPPVPPVTGPASGIGLPLFALDVGPHSPPATWPPVPLAGLDLGAWGKVVEGPV